MRARNLSSSAAILAATFLLAACGGAAALGPSATRSDAASVAAKPAASGREQFQNTDRAEKPAAEKPAAEKSGAAPSRSPAAPASPSAASPASVAASASQTAPSDIRGIYVYSSNIGQISTAYSQSVTKSLSVPGVDGLVLVAGWDALEPAMNQFQWGSLDQWLSQAASSGKKVELAVIAGSDTPAWLFQAAGAKALNFTVSPHSGKTDKCDSEIIAAPWDQAFLGQWDGFLGALAAHLKSSGTYDAVKIVRLTGINRTTDELRLPAETPQSTHLSCVTDSASTWQQAGYGPSLLAQAWDAITSSFQKAFPDKTFSVAIIPENPFPPIGDNGSQIKTGSTDENQPLLALASKKFPGHLVVQMNFLMSSELASPVVVQSAQSLGTLVAFQTNNYLGSSGQGAACAEPVTNPTPCTASTYLSLLQTGTYPAGQANSLRSQYIEVFPANALAFPDAIQQAHTALLAS